MSEETRTYNVLFPVSLLAQIHEKASEEKVSSPEIMRKAVEHYLSEPEAERVPHMIDTMAITGSYEQGVTDACDMIKDHSKLVLKNAIGQTLGMTIAAEIKRNLINE
jgi:hypothetical protein